MKEPRPVDFDWVTARDNCSIQQVFHALASLAKRNVDTRNEQQPGSVGFHKIETGSHFRVWSKGEHAERLSAEFTLTDETIEVRRRGESFTIRAVVDNAGECKCRIGGEDLDPWQVLLKILEPILFPQ